MAIFMISRRPLAPWNETACSYRHRFTGNHAVGSAESKREAAYAALRRRAETVAHSWRLAEPDTQFRVMDSGTNNMGKGSDDFGPFVGASAEEAEPARQGDRSAAVVRRPVGSDFRLRDVPADRIAAAFGFDTIDGDEVVS